MNLLKKPFWIGVILSPLLYIFLWFLMSKPAQEVAEPARGTPSILFDFVPKTPRTAVTKASFYEVSEDGTKKEVTLANFSGKPTIVHFWATWCEPCVGEMPELEKFCHQYGDKMNIVVVAMDQTGGKDSLKFFKEKGLKSLKLYIDEKKELLKSMKVTGLPTTVFVTSDGLEMGHVVGTIQWSESSGEFIRDNLAKGSMDQKENK
jgi:thiol-disulfide isomerase/thioredoxin